MDNSFVKVYEEDDKERFYIELSLGGMKFEGRWPYGNKSTAIQVAKNIARSLGIEYHD